MKEINEYTAEVLRRSEKRIRERKKRRSRILMCCIPLFICVSVFSLAVLPKISANKRADVLKDSYNSDSIFCSYVQVEIKDNNNKTSNYNIVTDKLEVDRLYSVVLSAFESLGNDSDYNEEFKNENDSETKEHTNVTSTKTENYTFIFATADADSTTYTLTDNILINKSSGQRVILNSNQLIKLKQAFKIKD